MELDETKTREFADKFAQLRQYIISEYRKLDRVQPASQTTHKEVSLVYESIVNSMDDLLKDYFDVKFK